MLEAVGLSPVQERAYTTLVARSPLTIAQLAKELDLSVEEAGAVAGSLEGLKLLTTMRDRGPSIMVAPPHIAMEALLARREQELRQARGALTELVTAYRFGQREREADEAVEVIRGQLAIRLCFTQIQRAARYEMLAFVKPPFALPGSENTVEFEVLERGVPCRAVYERSALELPGALHEVAGYVAAGEQARSVDRIPAKFVIADREVALIPIEAGQPELEPGVLLVQASALIEVMVELFESVWAQATPLRPGIADGDLRDPGPGRGRGLPLSDEDAQIVSLLLSGLSDKNVATQLGMSLRTVQRRVRHVMDLAKVHTRMQLGWHSARNGWM